MPHHWGILCRWCWSNDAGQLMLGMLEGTSCRIQREAKPPLNSAVIEVGTS